MNARITGAAFIGSHEKKSDTSFRAIDPTTGETIEPYFIESGECEVGEACGAAEAAFVELSEAPPLTRARFLETIADEIDGIGDELIVRAMRETALPRTRLEGERARTIGQLKLFANVVRDGDWRHATIDTAAAERQPPRSDLRRHHMAVGPVAVFGASNFPLAFSVAGGDTASAFAAGCPVVVKGHPAHPGTGELVARAVRSAVKQCGLHPGTFSYLPGSSNALGAALVSDPRIKAVGFTGSRSGGLALVALAAARAVPIPVYAEMSSINPVVLFPSALTTRCQELARGFAGSLTMGAGQFCTNPGFLLAIEGPDLDAFVEQAAAELARCDAQPMLSPGIFANYERGAECLASRPGVRTIARGNRVVGPTRGRAALFRTDAGTFLDDPTLGHEVFGASAIVVSAKNVTEMARVVDALEGQLTASLWLDPDDERMAAEILPRIARKVGRVIANGWPTGVQVSPAMVHGGPFPATSDSRTTSVGTLAIERFLRPICYQDFPDALLPAPLRRDNPWGVPRRVNGVD